MKKYNLIFYSALSLILLTNFTFALSNESIDSMNLLNLAKSSIAEMESKEIPTSRVNELYRQADQLYSAQIALEEKDKKADYAFINALCNEILSIKESAIKAKDELEIFKDEYNEAKQEYNLTSIEADYDNIERSFSEERFEDIIQLIDKGYKSLSDVQSSQTATRVFIENTSKTFTNFLKKNWVKILVTLIILSLLAIIFWKTIKRWKIKARIYTLSMQKDALYSQIKKLQSSYFKSKTISETEFYAKVDRFKEMIRDIDRQIPMLKEEMLKVNKKEQKQAKTSRTKK